MRARPKPFVLELYAAGAIPVKEPQSQAINMKGCQWRRDLIGIRFVSEMIDAESETIHTQKPAVKIRPDDFQTAALLSQILIPCRKSFIVRR